MIKFEHFLLVHFYFTTRKEKDYLAIKNPLCFFEASVFYTGYSQDLTSNGSPRDRQILFVFPADMTLMSKVKYSSAFLLVNDVFMALTQNRIGKLFFNTTRKFRSNCNRHIEKMFCYVRAWLSDGNMKTNRLTAKLL